MSSCKLDRDNVGNPSLRHRRGPVFGLLAFSWFVLDSRLRASLHNFRAVPLCLDCPV